MIMPMYILLPSTIVTS